MWNEVPQRAPAITPAEPTPTPDERVDHPYDGTLADDSCTKVSAELRSELEAVSGVGGALTYPQASMVRANATWWTVAVRVQVNDNSTGLEEGDVDEVRYFVTNLPHYPQDNWESATYSWLLSPTLDDRAAARAGECLTRLPTPTPKPSPGSPETYTGKLARKAPCTRVSSALLARLQEVGQVGGAVTYPSGRMVRSTNGWWTVAVTTAVHPNSLGLDRGNVEATALFVTNAPGRDSDSAAVTFPIRAAGKDAAATKALSCLSS